MKKFFVSLMALILGTTGYVVVDETIETRVETLESQVSELQENVSVLEGKLDDSDNPSEEETKHELVGTEIEIPMDTYTYTRYGYVNPEFDADAERVENELTIHSLKATIIDVDEYKTPDMINDIGDLTPYDTKYTIRIECNYTTNVKGKYYYHIEEECVEYEWTKFEYIRKEFSNVERFEILFNCEMTIYMDLGDGSNIIGPVVQGTISMPLASNYTGTFVKVIETTTPNPFSDKVTVSGFYENIDSEIPVIKKY